MVKRKGHCLKNVIERIHENLPKKSLMNYYLKSKWMFNIEFLFVLLNIT